MILDLARFIESERPRWEELERILTRLDRDGGSKLATLDEVTRFHYLYQRCSSDLARFSTFSAEPRTREYLEGIVARAYAEVHAHRAARGKWKAFGWLFGTVPRTFRSYFPEFLFALAITLAGCAFGAGALHFDPASKRVMMPFAGLQQSPAERVHREETSTGDRWGDVKGTFSAQLMTNNIRMAFLTFALGITWGLGSSVVLFYNGVTLGAVSADYIQAGFGEFLAGWLLPHGVVEIPAILIAGQASFVLARALVGWGARTTRNERLRLVSKDLLTLTATAGVMLVWAGIIEAFLSQTHQPVISYSSKIIFGMVELILLVLFFALAGRESGHR